MRKLTLVFGIFCLIASTSNAQTIKNGGLNGKIVSASNSSVAIDGTQAPIYVTPASGHFVLTQLGSALSGDALSCTHTISFSASKFGFLRAFYPQGPLPSEFLAKFEPGIALPPSSTISCAVLDCGDGTDCYITGVLEK